MCRLFGFRSNVPTRAHRSLVEAENAVTRQAHEHRDGWGIAYYLDSEVYVFKSETAASTDERFQKMCERLRSHTFLVHVRRATVGEVDSLNSHPFRHANWVFAHNGTLYGFTALREWMLRNTLPQLAPLIFGATDSEHLFYYLLTHLHDAGCSLTGRAGVSIQEAAAAQRHALTALYEQAERMGLEPPRANYILTNGREMFARRAGLELYLATQKRHCNDAQICQEINKVCLQGVQPHLTLLRDRTRRCNHLLIASEPVGQEDIWEEIPEGCLISLNETLDLQIHEAPDRFPSSWPASTPPIVQRSGVIPAEMSV